ncbi:DUF4309 domain-containing protein [Paenibacillus sp. GCM10023252]|uniref:YjgB family protein n=1 Tax=Paenibacillus sp. GCM10023252 TaxID=3252649 RepID=UPI00360D4B5E
MTYKLAAAAATVSCMLTITACSGGANNGNAPAPVPSATATPTPSLSPPATENPAGESDSDQVPATKQPVISVGTLVEEAKEGRVPGVEYAAHTALFDEIEEKWGKPDTQGSAGKGIYAEYVDRGITFGFNKGMLVFDVRSSRPDIQQLTVTDVEAALGKPDKTTKSGEDKIYTYQVNERFQLRFAIRGKVGMVHHISVYSAEDARNLMAG